MTTFPTWLTGPNGERRVFNSADEVPPGWVDGLHKSVRTGRDLPGHVPVPPEPEPQEDLSDTAERIAGRTRKPAKHK